LTSHHKQASSEALNNRVYLGQDKTSEQIANTRHDRDTKLLFKLNVQKDKELKQIQSNYDKLHAKFMGNKQL
jgi:hypothetical protein